jgi:hypothetical protein
LAPRLGRVWPGSGLPALGDGAVERPRKIGPGQNRTARQNSSGFIAAPEA